jgi:pyrroloquinoline quinone (PQQ) biosynthesis protein C
MDFFNYPLTCMGYALKEKSVLKLYIILMYLYFIKIIYTTSQLLHLCAQESCILQSQEWLANQNDLQLQRDYTLFFRQKLLNKKCDLYI